MSARPRVALVGPEEEENLGLRYLAAALDAAGFIVDIVVVNGEDDVLRAGHQLLAARPDVVGLTLAFQWRAPDFLGLAVWLRQQGFAGHITSGGHFGTLEAAAILRDFPELDTVCLHEAEHTLTALCRAVVARAPFTELAGVACRGVDGAVRLNALPPRPELDALPWPDRRGPPASCVGHRAAPLVGSRGCYAHCSFCCIATWHALAEGKRFRLRDPDEVADEMHALQRERGVDIFIFHDDNFFLPTRAASLRRLSTLADALDRRGLGPYAIVAKARPVDLDADILALLQQRLRCIRLYVGIESDADQGLRTLQRGLTREDNHAAMTALRVAGMFATYNLLLFDPDTTPDSLATNLAFMESHADFPMNFCRTELYAGTPLLQRMQREGRAEGDYLAWDYSMATPEVERMARLALAAFHPRNFGAGALANGLMHTCFDAVVAHHFHPDQIGREAVHAARAFARELTGDTVAGLREIITHVATQPAAADRAFQQDLARRLRAREVEVGAGAAAFAARLSARLSGAGATRRVYGTEVVA